MSQRKSSSLLEQVGILPWWVNIILALITFVTLKYVIPSIVLQPQAPIEYSYILFSAIIDTAPSLSPLAFLFVISAIISHFNCRKREKRREAFISENSLETPIGNTQNRIQSEPDTVFSVPFDLTSVINASEKRAELKKKSIDLSDETVKQMELEKGAVGAEI